MSKVYSEQVQKANMLVAGMRKNFDLVKNHGITLEQLSQLEEAAKEAAVMNQEVEALRRQTSAKAAQANQKLIEVKDAMRDAKRVVKGYFEQTKWESFGVFDKR
jgi:hypothetical protein